MQSIVKSVVVLACVMPLAAQAAQRTFVSIAGSDGNVASNCSTSAPCRGFSAALTVTDAGGEIVVLNSGGYGPVTIDKNVAITAPAGVYAGISVISSSTNGISIATAGVEVVLRGIAINNLADSTNGILLSDGAKLTLERCSITGFSSSGYSGLQVRTAAQVQVTDSFFQGNYNGVHLSNGASGTIARSVFSGHGYTAVLADNQFDTASATTTAHIVDTVATQNERAYRVAGSYSGSIARMTISGSVGSKSTSNGLSVVATTGSAQAVVNNSTLAENLFGIYANGANAKVTISGNTIAHNSTGVAQTNSSVIESAGNNAVRDNTSNTSGTITTFGAT